MTAGLIAPAPADAPELAALMRRCFTETFGHLYRPQDLAAFLRTQSAANWRRQLDDPAISVRAVSADAALVGFAKIGPIQLPVAPAGPAMELRQLYVLHAHQGTGLGQRLMAWVIDEARRRGARELFLSVFVENARARRFYQRFGFERVGTYAFMVGDHADQDDLMRLAL